MSFKLIHIIYFIILFQLSIFTVFLIHKGRKDISNRILAAFFITQVLVISNWLLCDLTLFHIDLYVRVVFTTFPIAFLWGPLMYFYIRSQVEKDFIFKPADIRHLFLFIVAFFVVLTQFYVYDSSARIYLLKSPLLEKKFHYSRMLLDIQIFFYNLSAFIQLTKFQRTQKEYRIKKKQNLSWLKLILFGYIVVCFIGDILILAGKHIPISFEFRIIFVFSSFLIFFNALFYTAMIKPDIIIKTDEKPKYSKSYLEKSDIEKYSQLIIEYMTIEKPYLNSELTLKEFSGMLGISEKIISQVINRHWSQNFYIFINSFRIEEAKRLLASDEFEKIKMLGIAFESGFNSKTVFYDTFKKYIGMTPTDYRKVSIQTE